MTPSDDIGVSVLDHHQTESVCPVCLSRIPALREQVGDEVLLVKTCPGHGTFRTKIWKGLPAFGNWRRPKIPYRPVVTYRDVQRGCPYDCGLCAEHRQRSCTVLLEVTQTCDLNCPVCYADSRPGTSKNPTLEEVGVWYDSVRKAANGCNIQLSGGEPTLRDDLPQIVALGKERGFSFLQLNTNGLRLARDERYVASLKEAGLSSVFLQFDGADDAIHERLRGRRLLKTKLDAVAACGKQEIGVVLVATLAPGVNTNNVGEILNLAVELSPVVRGVHFQPVSYFGRYPHAPANEDRITLPELMAAIEEQTRGKFRAAHFSPPGCENALCSFHGNFLLKPDGMVQPLGPASSECCGRPEPAEEGAARTISRVARQWSAPACCSPSATATQKDDSTPGHGSTGFISLDDFINLARVRTLSVSAMAFQDAWNLDLERVKDCCIHVMAPDGALIPFCLYNLTSAAGERLYRP